MLMSAQPLGQLQLYQIVAISPDGKPVLADTNARILTTGRAMASDVGRMAVCQHIEEAGVHLIVVMGVISDTTPPASDEQPLVIGHGNASLALHRDGRIRMTGSEIDFDIQSGFNVTAGRIDLN